MARRTAERRARSGRTGRWPRQLDAGVDSSVTEIAAAERIYVSRTLRLALPATDLARLMMPVPVEWQRPRQRFC
jgi:hypothetical protein